MCAGRCICTCIGLIAVHCSAERQPCSALFSSFGQQSVDLEYEAFASKTTLDDLQSKHYPGVGNDVQKLHHAIDNLENMAAVSHKEEEDGTHENGVARGGADCQKSTAAWI